MNIFQVLVLSVAVQSFYCHVIATKNETDRMAQNKSPRELETYTTLILDDEAYSIATMAKHPKNQSTELRKNNHHLKGSKLKQQHTPSFRLSLLKGTKADLKSSHSDKHTRNQSSHKKEKINKLNKSIFKRHFGELKNNYRKTRQQHYNIARQSDNIPLMHPVSNTTNYSSVGEVAKPFSNVPNTSEANKTIGTSNNFSKNSGQYPSIKTNLPSFRTSRDESFYKSSTPVVLEPVNSMADIFPNHHLNHNYNGLRLHENNATGSYRNNVKPSGEFVRPYARDTVSRATQTITTSSSSSKTFARAAVIEQKLPVIEYQPKNGTGEDTPTDETEADDTVISFGGSCDQTINETCWMQREVGDVLTLSINIISSKKSESFQVRWMKVYHISESKKGKPLELEPAKLPWNMVSGSEERELRLNPVTNSDIDPNCLVAKVFLITKHRGKTLFTQMKKLFFRIEIPIIDMGKIYAGEELSINIENFISLPERGNLLMDWFLESKPHQYESLPSNIKVSNSGRSVVLKELKQGRMGVLNCVIYSNLHAVAKRRFNILKIDESVKRRSAAMGVKDRRIASDVQRSRRCRHAIKRNQEKAMKRFEEGNRPKSRKKRFRRMESDTEGQTDMDCEPLRMKVYSRWVRSLFGQSTTEDPRLMPIEKLFELSEQGDGTLDDEIPHEVHYVSPKVRSFPGTLVERSRQLPFIANCSSNDDCGKDAICIIHEEEIDPSGRKGYCSCRPEFYGDGFTCQKIPASSHREKRLRRSPNKDFAVPKHLFYEGSKQIVPPVTTATEIVEKDEDPDFPPKVLAFEEEESFLLSECLDDKDCSAHANCIQPSNGHPYCKCRPGFRGNGIFCWEIIDYVPLEEHFVPEDEINPAGPIVSNDLVMDRLAMRTVAPNEQEYEQDR